MTIWTILATIFLVNWVIGFGCSLYIIPCLGYKHRNATFKEWMTELKKLTVPEYILIFGIGMFFIPVMIVGSIHNLFVFGKI